MERQDINFLSTITIQQESLLNAKLIVQVAVGWILLLILVYLITLSSSLHKKTATASLKVIKNNLQVQVDALPKKMIPLSNKTPDLSSKLFTGFYHYLEDLTLFTPPKVWLDNIIISQTNNSILLKGTATTAAEISIFLNALKKSNSFNNKQFNILQLQKTPISNNVNFTIKL